MVRIKIQKSRTKNILNTIQRKWQGHKVSILIRGALGILAVYLIVWATVLYVNTPIEEAVNLESNNNVSYAELYGASSINARTIKSFHLTSDRADLTVNFKNQKESIKILAIVAVGSADASEYDTRILMDSDVNELKVENAELIGTVLVNGLPMFSQQQVREIFLTQKENKDPFVTLTNSQNMKGTLYFDGDMTPTFEIRFDIVGGKITIDDKELVPDIGRFGLYLEGSIPTNKNFKINFASEFGGETYLDYFDSFEGTSDANMDIFTYLSTGKINTDYGEKELLGDEGILIQDFNGDYLIGYNEHNLSKKFNIQLLGSAEQIAFVSKPKNPLITIAKTNIAEVSAHFFTPLVKEEYYQAPTIVMKKRTLGDPIKIELLGISFSVWWVLSIGVMLLLLSVGCNIQGFGFLGIRINLPSQLRKP